MSALRPSWMSVQPLFSRRRRTIAPKRAASRSIPVRRVIFLFHEDIDVRSYHASCQTEKSNVHGLHSFDARSHSNVHGLRCEQNCTRLNVHGCCDRSDRLRSNVHGGSDWMLIAHSNVHGLRECFGRTGFNVHGLHERGVSLQTACDFVVFSRRADRDECPWIAHARAFALFLCP